MRKNHANVVTQTVHVVPPPYNDQLTGTFSLYLPVMFTYNSADVESADYRTFLRKRGFLRFAIIPLGGFVILYFLFSLKYAFNATPMFSFEDIPKPGWIDKPAKSPLVLRIAIISAPDESERRQVMREAVLRDIKESEMRFEYKFFIGVATGWLRGSALNLSVSRESQKHQDIVVLDEIEDIPERLSEKRFSALKWGGSVSNDTYDYFMTMDSDTFCRFNVMPRWMPELLNNENVNPRDKPVLIGRMANHLTYFQNRIPDGNKDASLEDEFVKGPWFQYPMGVGYMLSSSLAKTMLAAEPSLPHHIHYPSDDVMVGAWIAGLRNFQDESIKWESTAAHSPLPIHRLYPRPYLPYVVDTKIVDDKIGWHDPPGRSGNDAPISWNSVCIHHLSPEEMKTMRTLKQFRGEWSQ
ncbi:galactosyltransferase-domain-containing protein [Cyathus striatus]|nr:galactosyltransferase-domain-containing protein [Cyathus striatus]